MRPVAGTYGDRCPGGSPWCGFLAVGHLPPVGACRIEDITDRLPIRFTQTPKTFFAFLVIEYRLQSTCDERSDGLGQSSECGRLDQVATGELEQSLSEVELSKRAAVFVFEASSGKLGGKLRRALNRRLQCEFIDEQHVSEQILGDSGDASFRNVAAEVGRAIECLVVELVVVVDGVGFEVGPGDQIVHSGLVFEHHECDEVAVGREVHVGVEPFVEPCEVGSGLVIEILGWCLERDHGVSHVPHRAVGAGDVVASPTLSKGARVIGDEGAGTEVRLSRGCGVERADDGAGDIIGPTVGVAQQALASISLELW